MAFFFYRDSCVEILSLTGTSESKKDSKWTGKNSHFAAVKRSKEVTFPCCCPRHLPGQLVPVTWNTCLLRNSLQNLMLGNAKAFFLTAMIAFFPLISRKEMGDDHLHHQEQSRKHQTLSFNWISFSEWQGGKDQKEVDVNLNIQGPEVTISLPSFIFI